MQYIQTSDWQVGAQAILERLMARLAAGRQVLWLISGGSNLQITVSIMHALPDELTANLTIMPVDERYGPEGHADSNWAGLLRAGFAPRQAHLLPVLQGDTPFEATQIRYEQLITQALRQADTVIGQFGIGEDAHIAGILPHSPAVQEAKALVAGYQSQPFQRLTLTFPALRQVTAAYALAYGGAKRPALQAIRDTPVDLGERPGQILRELSEAYLYNDQIGGTV